MWTRGLPREISDAAAFEEDCVCLICEKGIQGEWEFSLRLRIAGKFLSKRSRKYVWVALATDGSGKLPRFIWFH